MTSRELHQNGLEDNQKLIPFEDENGKMGYMNADNHIVIPAIWEYACDFCEDLAGVESAENGKFGFIDKTGKCVIPCIWDLCGCFSDGLAYVKKDGKYGFYNNRGKIVVPCNYSKEMCELEKRFYLANEKRSNKQNNY